MGAPIRVVVVGGSLGGLTAALVLRDLGCEVGIHERAGAPLDSRGAGIVLHGLTERYLTQRRRVPIDRFATRARHLRYVDAQGRSVAEAPIGYRFTAWNTLYRRLLECFPRDRYHLGSTVSRVHASGGVDFADGGSIEADLVVCADGLRSLARQSFLPGVATKYAGYVGWRGVMPESDLSRTSREHLADAIVYHLMPGSHVLTYPIPGPETGPAAGDRLLNFVWYRNIPEADVGRLLTDAAGHRRTLSVPAGAVAAEAVRELRTAAGTLPPAIAELVASTREPFIQQIIDVDVPQMAFGRACLVGDAAFVVRPHAAAGTAKAAADAWALADALSESGMDVTGSLSAWEGRQLALGRSLLERVRALGDSIQFGAGWRAGDPALRFGLGRPGDSEE